MWSAHQNKESPRKGTIIDDRPCALRVTAHNQTGGAFWHSIDDRTTTHSVLASGWGLQTGDTSPFCVLSLNGIQNSRRVTLLAITNLEV